MSGLVLGEVTVFANFVQDLLVYALQVNRGGGSDNISGIHPSEGNTIDFKGTGDEENTLGKVLEDDDTLAAEATSKEDYNGAGLEGLTGLCRADRLAGLESQLAELQLKFQRPHGKQSVHVVAAILFNARPVLPSLPLQTVLSPEWTYLFGDSDILGRVVLASPLRVVRYRPLALGELLVGGLRVLLFGRHFVSLLSLVALGSWGSQT